MTGYHRLMQIRFAQFWLTRFKHKIYQKPNLTFIYFLKCILSESFNYTSKGYMRLLLTRSEHVNLNCTSISKYRYSLANIKQNKKADTVLNFKLV